MEDICKIYFFIYQMPKYYKNCCTQAGTQKGFGGLTPPEMFVKVLERGKSKGKPEINKKL